MDPAPVETERSSLPLKVKLRSNADSATPEILASPKQRVTETVEHGKQLAAVSDRCMAVGVARRIGRGHINVFGRDVDVFGGDIDLPGWDVDVFCRNVDLLCWNIDMPGRDVDVLCRRVDFIRRNDNVHGRHVHMHCRYIDMFGRHVNVHGRYIEVLRRHIHVDCGNVDVNGWDIDAHRKRGRSGRHRRRARTSGWHLGRNGYGLGYGDFRGHSLGRGCRRRRFWT